MGLVNKPFGDIITFSRNGGGGLTNAQGQYEWVGNNAPRFDYDPVTLQARGLLIEEQRVNLLLQSGDPSAVVWTKDSVTLGSPTAGPLGNETPVYETSASAFFRVRQQASSVVSGTAYTYTFAIKKLGRRYVYIRSQARTLSNENIGFDLDTTTTTFVPAGWSASIRIISPGIYELTATCTATTTNDIVHGVLSSNIAISSNTLLSYSGDPSQGFIYIRGQLEAGSFPTSYIPTVASQVTRAADVASVNTLAPWYNASEGTIVASWSHISDLVPAGTGQYVVALTKDLSVNDVLTIGRNAFEFSESISVVGGTNNTLSGKLIADTAPHKAAVAFSSTGRSFATDGGAFVSGTSPSAGFNALFIGNRWDSIRAVNGHIRSIQYLPRRLTNTELQAITAV